MRRRQRRMRGNLPGPEGLARRGASAALHGLPVVPTTGGAARLASAPSPCQRGSRGILRQSPGSVDAAAVRTARDRTWFRTGNQRFERRRRDGGGPIQGAVAAAAIQGGRDVPDLLGDGAVAGAAILVGLDVPYRFARSGDAIVAARAGGGNASMVEVSGNPGKSR